MSGGLVPSIDFTPLSRLGETIRTGMRERDRREALQGLGVSPGDPNFLPKLGQTLVGLGDIEGALTVSRLQEASQDRTYQRTRDARQDAFQERAFNVGREDAAYTRSRQDRLDTRSADQERLRNYYLDQGDKRAQESLELQRQQATRREFPAGYEADPANPGGQRAISGGPQDPATIGRIKAAEAEAKTGPGQNPFAGQGTKFNADQGKAAGFTDRMLQSEGIIGSLESEGTSSIQRGLNMLPGIGNYATSENFKQYDQARRDFINAQLRRESGAAIGAGEFESANRQYFPQPGDGPKVIEQKRANRRAAIEAMGREGGESYVPKQIFDQSGKLVPYQAPQRAQPGAQSSVNPRMISRDQIPEGRRFRAEDGRIYRRVNGQDVPE